MLEPTHICNDKVVLIYATFKDDIDELWMSMSEDTTMAEAVLTWLEMEETDA